MPRFTPTPAPRCPRCHDSIFATELKIGPASIAYHARCLTCSLCNKRLDSTLQVEHEGQPYCKHCHAKMLGTGANGFTRAVPMQPRSPQAAGVRVGAFSSPGSPTSAPKVLASTGSPSPHRATSSVSSVASSSRAAGATNGSTGAASSSLSSTSDEPSPPPTRFSFSSASKPSQPFLLSSERTQPASSARRLEDEDDGAEFGPGPVPPRAQPTPVAQSMDDLVNQVGGITIRPRGIGVVPTSRAGDDDDIDAASTVATVGGLPPPRRLTPSKHGPTTGYKTAPAFGGGTSGLSRLGLDSSISAAAGGTPLCARCAKPVYFAEQKQGAGRKWHRACLRCDGCSAILESGRLEEGPAHGGELATTLHPQGGKGANVWCKNCYAKHFGPKGIGVGMSVPDSLLR
ncbi:unnamed protein product [Tilletia laevis]|uniref:LIM zinc-binding domain-containing protein n=2 Tax=Tilletia TaxID=13289 RepID=A0A177VGY0_9BASI|nr:hypothetical protein CF336_g1342 [Tilletia laevis]KAE8264367.1 hypothetical protein A4X03_0g1006 [Tilletia caries]KAE8207895.1 hypothetical protein CF335_g815 [Tilletia laevis]CAD6885882.1 unnamed protein product [Tilletia caries]CAD6908874.1 unnamed protein product [Tilletia caries]